MTEPKYKVVLTKQAKEQLFDLMIDADKDDLKTLQGMLDQLRQAAEDGTLDEMSDPVDMDKLAIEDPVLYDQLIQALEDIEDEESEVLN